MAQQQRHFSCLLPPLSNTPYFLFIMDGRKASNTPGKRSAMKLHPSPLFLYHLIGDRVSQSPILALNFCITQAILECEVFLPQPLKGLEVMVLFVCVICGSGFCHLSVGRGRACHLCGGGGMPLCVCVGEHAICGGVTVICRVRCYMQGQMSHSTSEGQRATSRS